MLLHIKKVQDVIGSTHGVEFISALDNIVDDGAVFQLHPDVKGWLQSIREYVLNTPLDQVDDARDSIQNRYDEAIKQLEYILQVRVTCHLCVTPTYWLDRNAVSKKPSRPLNHRKSV